MKYYQNTRHGMSPEELERRRLKAPGFFLRGASQYATAKALGVSKVAVHYWHKEWKKKGKEGLLKRSVGPKGKLTPGQIKKVEQALLQGPKTYGYKTDLWTLARITEAVKKITKTVYKNRSIWHVLLRMGWSCQKPARKAKERDEKAIARWKRVEWPSIKKRGFA